ncbi:HAD family hydrolase [Halorubellus sp. JP-L1]|uniref:HAD family hydrolase n=1 Tax=Halorubellus sp. JP-L1 TaxID=2715753 RepID=UPI0014094DC7|nr:HAD family hydrolase [Halorubellus sp. JP-L1]NHN41328.1 HAD family hydrolase [Halorubellus sp. JP-L1]
MVADAYDYWLFDLDGTLVDAEWSYTRDVFDRVGDRLGREFSDREAYVLWHGLTGPRNPQLHEYGIDPEAFWRAFHAEEDPQTRAEHTFLHEDAAFVGDLDRPVGLVTHCQRFLADPVLEHLDVADWFDVVVCCDDDTGWKPDPAPVELARDGLGVDGDDAGVLAGDGSNDVGAAWNAGLDAIHVERHGHERRGHCVRGDYRVEAFTDVLEGQ